MLLLSCSHLKKYYQDRLVIDLPEFSLYSEDKIGVVGPNGAGKTTLLHLLSQKLRPDEGWVKTFCDFAFVSQLSDSGQTRISPEMAARFKVSPKWTDNLSGGEQTRFKLAASFEKDQGLLFADEPTSNLDLEGIELVERWLKRHKGGLLLVSHDRSLLDQLCNKILEIDQGKIRLYPGSYAAYQQQKKLEGQRLKSEYDQYVAKKKRLERATTELQEASRLVRKAPKRMGNAEARLHKMGDQKAKASLDKRKKGLESRLQHLEVRDRPVGFREIHFDLIDQDKVHSKILIEGKNINKSFGEKRLFNDASFAMEKGSKVALIGPNGSGKSTLIKMIIEQEAGIKIAPAVKMGYFSQDLNQLKEDRTILENVMDQGIYSESFGRTLLARLRFIGDRVHGKVKDLSGGERMKVAFAKILLGEYNLLVLDEPTNHLDIQSLEVVEEALKNYQNSLLFVSHDRSFIHGVADHIMEIAQGKIDLFHGTYQMYLERGRAAQDRQVQDLEKECLLLENRLSELLAKLSLPGKGNDLSSLNRDYEKTLNQLKERRMALDTIKKTC